MTLPNLDIRNRIVAVAVATMAFAMTHAQEIYRMEDNPAAVQLRTNGMYWMALSPNIGMEIQTDLGLAFQLDYVGAWWNSHASNHYFSNYGFQTEMRYYFGAPRQEMPYRGHHVGGYFQMATYDFEFGGKGYQCKDLDKSLGFGISYGYSMPLNRHLSLDLTAGVGYFTSKYMEYQPSGDWYAPTAAKKLSFFGPTKLEVSLIWNCNRKNNK